MMKERDLQEQLEILKQELLDRAMSPVIGTYEGKPVKQCDIMFDPMFNTYKIKTDHGIVEVDPKYISLSKQSEFDDIYRKTEVDDAIERHTYTDSHKDGCGVKLGARQKAGTAQAAADAQFDDWYRKQKANSHYGVDVRYRGANSHSDPLASRASAGWRLDGTGSRSQPWDDPLAPLKDKTSNTVACTDLPDWTAGLDASQPMKVYYHSRWPSKPANVIIDDAIELLRKNKGVDIRVIKKDASVRYGDETPTSAYLDYGTRRQYGPNIYRGNVIEAELPVRAFDRITSDIDKSARLRGRMDTDTYITLRIAFLLLEAAKLGDRDAERVDLDVFKIHKHVTKPILDF